MESFKSLCVALLSVSLTVDTVIEVLLLSEKHNLADLKSTCLYFVKENRAQMMKTNGWNESALTNRELFALLDDHDDVKKRFEKRARSERESDLSDLENARTICIRISDSEKRSRDHFDSNHSDPFF